MDASDREEVPQIESQYNNEVGSGDELQRFQSSVLYGLPHSLPRSLEQFDNEHDFDDDFPKLDRNAYDEENEDNSSKSIDAKTDAITEKVDQSQMPSFGVHRHLSADSDNTTATTTNEQRPPTIFNASVPSTSKTEEFDSSLQPAGSSRQVISRSLNSAALKSEEQIRGQNKTGNQQNLRRTHTTKNTIPPPGRQSVMMFSEAKQPRKSGGIFSSSLTLRRTKGRFASSTSSGNRTHHGKDDNSAPAEDRLPQLQRRYKPGDYVLIDNHQSRWTTLVNRYGFPPGEGETPREREGPYNFVLAKVKQIHFEEIAAYYTVTRFDTHADQRADAHVMEPVRSSPGQQAAMRAATQTAPRAPGDEGGYGAGRGTDDDAGGRSKLVTFIQDACDTLLMPILWLYDCLYYVVASFLFPFFTRFGQLVRQQAERIVNGRDPYVCRVRLTAVNLVVVCSTWFLFIDQARLSFFPPETDHTLAVVNFAVWVVLVLELIFEVFIRPDGYQNLIVSDKAFAPSTVRFINMFHLSVEALSLAIFIPEFYCILSADSCGQRYRLSFFNAAFIGITGPSRADAFYGHAYFALVRLRIFGLVRHWRNMWIANNYINSKWKAHQGPLAALIAPAKAARSVPERGQIVSKKSLHMQMEELENKDNSLTKASNIETALMVTNSHRALLSLWLITGFFPIIFAFETEFVNSMALMMTEQLQATNLMVPDDSAESCNFLLLSIAAWILGMKGAKGNSPFLVSLDVNPKRCWFNDGGIITSRFCDYLNVTLYQPNLLQTNLSDFLAIVKSSQTGTINALQELCPTWWVSGTGESVDETAMNLGLREGAMVSYNVTTIGNLTIYNPSNDGLDAVGVQNSSDTLYQVLAVFDFTESIQIAATASLILQFCILVAVLGGLSILRRDAEVLVLGPLRRMLKIVARYARNPLVPPKIHRRLSMKRKPSGSKLASDAASDDSSEESSDGSIGDAPEIELGSFETEQLITAVTKITDLLRKCWGVAGADIISTNLATREGALAEVFNPTVPGKSVYALFGFATINGFDHLQRNLGGEVINLINDVAYVLHSEVFRWGFADSGQCNKNLGSSFLMVFRIGSVQEVVEKLEQATDVIFSTGNKTGPTSTVHRRRAKQNTSNPPTASAMVPSMMQSVMGGTFLGSGGASGSPYVSGSVHGSMPAGQPPGTSQVSTVVNARASAVNIRKRAQRDSNSVPAMSLSLQSLPGISTFTDLAVMGMLKSYAGIYRDVKIREWNRDYRVGSGVGTFTVSMTFGLDAGWAVEGAVGSEYKIDATYLSPHVNMASRMMSACKQYGVTILMSQAVQELMSDPARAKLRHVDTVTVKGSSVKQRIYTYDAKAKGVDFFLYSRSEEQADLDAEHYAPSIWNTDQDLRAMRQHVTDDFVKVYREGHKAYLMGDWSTAMKKLERANDIMFETALEEGYLEEEFDALDGMDGEEARQAAEEMRRDNGDGPSIYLIQLMKGYGGHAPVDWEGWHPLTRK